MSLTVYRLKKKHVVSRMPPRNRTCLYCGAPNVPARETMCGYCIALMGRPT